MQTTYRIKAQEISMAFLKSLKTMFAGQEVEIIVKSVDPKNDSSINKKGLLKMINENRQKAPVINPDIDIRGLIDNAQNPS
jgi:hypothetical protein